MLGQKLLGPEQVEETQTSCDAPHEVVQDARVDDVGVVGPREAGWCASLGRGAERVKFA